MGLAGWSVLFLRLRLLLPLSRLSLLYNSITVAFNAYEEHDTLVLLSCSLFVPLSLLLTSSLLFTATLTFHLKNKNISVSLWSWDAPGGIEYVAKVPPHYNITYALRCGRRSICNKPSEIKRLLVELVLLLLSQLLVPTFTATCVDCDG